MNVILISIVFTIYLCIGVNVAYKNLHSSNSAKHTENVQEAKVEAYIEANEEQEVKIITADEEIENMLDTSELVDDIWQIEIPKINLSAPIAEGTTQEVMREYVGHFEETSLWEGNIGLAAHNRRI